MFDLPVYLRKKGLPHHVIWTYAFHQKDILKYVSKDEILKIDLKKFCAEFGNLLPTPGHHESELKEKFSVYLSANMLLGLTRVFSYHVCHLYEECERSLCDYPENIRRASPSGLVDSASQALVDIYDHQGSLGPIEDPTTSQVARYSPPIPSVPFDDVGDFDFQENVPPPSPVPSPARQPRQRAAKRNRRNAGSDDDDDGNQRRKRRPRQKAVRKAAVASVARHEDITLRDVAPLRDALEQDLENDLEPLDEDVLNDASTPAPVPFDDVGDFDYPDNVPAPSDFVGIDALTATSVSRIPSRQGSLAPTEDRTTYHVARSPPPTEDPTTYHVARSPPPLPFDDAGDFDYPENTRAASPSDVVGIDVLALRSAIASQAPSRQGSLAPTEVARASPPLPFGDAGDFDYPENIRSASPPDLVGIDVLALRSASASNAPSHRGSVAPPGDDTTYHVTHSRSNSPSRAVKRVRKPRTPRKPRSARENPLILSNEVLRKRDDVYCQKDLFAMKTGRIQERIATAHEIYKKYLGDDVNIEIDDVLRDKFRNLSMNPEQARRRDTRDRSSVRVGSRLTDFASLRSPQHTDTAPADIYDQDFDYDFRPATPRVQTPVRQLSRSPSRQIRQSGMDPSFGDIDYFEPEPLPHGMEHLMSPVRPVAAISTSGLSPVKELACSYGHDELYMLIVNQAVKEKKAVFKFKEFAKKWPRSFIAKQFHNFLLLIEMRKIIALSKSGAFHSFLIIPNELCLNQVSRCASLHRRSAQAVQV